MSWKEVHIGDNCQVLSAKRIFAKDYVASGIPFYRSKEIIYKAFNQFNKDEVFIKEERFNNIKNKFGAPQRGDILISSVGNRSGISYWVKEEYDFYFKDGNLIWFRNFNDEMSSKYLVYFLNSKLGQAKINNMFIGAAQKALTIEGVKSIKLSLPPLQTQKRIADILSNYDDLIENNLKRIKLLEESAQNIYKEWFVNMKFPGYEYTPFNKDTGIHEGWEKRKMETIFSEYIGGGWGKENLQNGFDKKAYVIRGTDFNKIRIGSFDSIPLRFHKESNLASRRLINGDLILEVSNGNLKKVGDVFLISSDIIKGLDFDIICASFCKMLRPKTLEMSIFIYHYIIDMNITDLMLKYKSESAAGINNFHFNNFLKKEIIKLPSNQTLYSFHNIVNPIHQKVSNLRRQNQKLKEVRDILLPRLMNQTIKV